MAKSSQEVYEKFVNFCSISLKGENPKFLDLIKSRYEGCDYTFRCSDEMINILEKTQRNMSADESRKFVHLKVLLTELKINTSIKRKKKNKKRRHSSDSCSESEHTDKVPKLKECVVVVEKFSHDDTSLHQDVNSVKIDDCQQCYSRKLCCITDGNLNSALSIVVADDEQVSSLREELGSGLECYNGSPTSPIWNEEPSTSRKVDSSSKNTSTHYQCGIYDSDSASTSNFSDIIKEKSSKKSVSILGIDNIAKECCIRSGTLCCFGNDNPSNVEQSETRHVESQYCGGNTIEYKTKNNYSILKTVSIRTADDEFSNSPELHIIESPTSCKELLRNCLHAKDENSKTPQLDYLHSDLAKTAVIASKESLYLEIDSLHDVLSDNKSDDSRFLSSANRCHSDVLPGTNLGKLSFQEPFVAPDSVSLSSHVSTDTTSCESEKALKLQDQPSDVDQDSLICEENAEKEESICESSSVLQSQDSSTVEVKGYDKKPAKRVPLLLSTKTDATTSNCTFGVKDTYGSEEKAAQDSKSISTNCNVGSSWVEDTMLETGGASADEFHENKGLDKIKLKQKRVIKLERLLGSLRDEIEKCQDSEMTLEDLDDENAAYIFEGKLKRKFVAAWNKLCEITGRSFTTGRPTERTIRYSGTRYKEINCRIEKFLNKKKIFPDFHDIKSIIKLTNKKCNLNLNSMMINDIAREAFVDIGEMLQTRRHQDFISTFGTRHTDILSSGVDPYLADTEFRRKMDNNRQIARFNLDSVIAKYAKLQYDRNCGDNDKEEDEEADDNNDDEEEKQERNIEAESKEKKKNKAHSKDVEDFVTTASVEVDMADEDDEIVTDFNSYDASNTSQVPAAGYNPKVFILGRSSYLLTPEKYKCTLKKSDSDISIETEFSNNEKPIDENSAKSRLESWNATFSENPCYLGKQENNSEASISKVEVLAVPEKKGRNIKYTARKPLLPVSELVKNIDCSEISGYLGSTKTFSYTCENSKTNAEDKNDGDEEEEDQSSDSTSEKDSDDKSLDDEVDEIAMSINNSTSECDTASSRGLSPVSIVFLSSDSLDDLSDNDENNEGRQAEDAVCAIKAFADDKQISHLKDLSKQTQVQCENNSLERRLFLHAKGQMQCDNNSLEKHQFLHAVGIQKRETEVHDVADEKLCRLNKTDNTNVSQVIDEAAEQITSNQTHSIIGSKGRTVDKQQVKSTAENDCFIVQDSCLTPERKISRDSDDCIIINDTPKNMEHMKETSVDVEKDNLENKYSLCSSEDISELHEGQTKISESETNNHLHLLSEESICADKNKGIIKRNGANEMGLFESSAQNDQEMNKPENATGDLIQNKLEDNANKDFINIEIDTVEIGVKKHLCSAARHSIEEREFEQNTAQNILSTYKVQTVSACELKEDREELEQSSKCAAMCVTMSESFGANKTDKSTEVPEGENITGSKMLNSPSPNSYCQNLDHHAVGEKPVPNKARNPNNTTSVKHSNAERNQSFAVSEEALLKETEAIDDDVITLDDSSTDHVCNQASSLYSELPLNEENNSHVEKDSLCNADENIKKNHSSFHASYSHFVSDRDNLCSNKIVSRVVQEDVQESHEDECLSPSLVPFSKFKATRACSTNNHPEDKLISDDFATAQCMVEVLESGQSASNQCLSELSAENTRKSVQEGKNFNPPDFNKSNSSFSELRPETAGENVTAESWEDDKNVVIVCDNISDVCSNHVNNEATNGTDQEGDAKDNCVDEICTTGEIMGTLREQLNNQTSRNDQNIIEAQKKLKYQSTSKQSQENLSQDLIEDSSVFEVFTDNGNGIGEEPVKVTELTVNPGLHIDQSTHENILEHQEGLAPLKSKQSDESFLHIKGSNETGVSTRNQELEHDGNQSTLSLCDMKDTLCSSVGEKYVCHSFEDDRSKNKNVSTENINEYGLCDRIDVKASSEHSKYSGGGDIPSEKMIAACSIIRCDGNDMISENIAYEGKDAPCNKDIHVNTSKHKIVDDTIITSSECEMARTEHISVDKNNGRSEHDAVIADTVECAKSVTKSKVMAYEVDDDDEDSVDLLIDSPICETVVENCGISVSQSTNCTRTIIDLSGVEHLHSESENSDILSKKLGIQIQGDHSASTPQSVLDMSCSQSSISQLADSPEVEKVDDVNSINAVSLTEGSDTTVDNSVVKVSLSSEKKGPIHSVLGNDEKHEAANNKELMVTTSSETESFEWVNFQVSEIQAVNPRKDEETVSVIKYTECGSIAKQTESVSLADEDEIKIIEELSSVKGVRFSENSKEDDRRLVDQFLLDIELNKSKVVTLSSGNNATLAAACPLSGECWDISEDEGPSSSLQKTLSEKSDCSLITNSLYHSSVLSVECEEVVTNEEKLSPLSTQTAVSVDSQAKVTKRSHDDAFSGRLSNKANELDCEVEYETSKCVIEVLPQLKKQKVVKPDFITDIISSVFSAFPAGGKTCKLSSLATKYKPHSKGKDCNEKNMTPSSKSLIQGIDDNDDEDIVIMEETPPNSAHRCVVPVSLNKSKILSQTTPAAFKKHASSRTCSSLEKLASPVSDPLQHKRHLELQTSSNSRRMIRSVPTSFHTQSQVHSSNFYKKSSTTSNNQPPLPARVKDSHTPSNCNNRSSNNQSFLPASFKVSHTPSNCHNRTSALGKANFTHPLPRLMPRVPIPSIQPNRTSDVSRTYPNHQDNSIAAKLPRRRSQFTSSGHINSSSTSHPDNRMRPHMSNTSVSRNKSINPVIVPPDNSGKAGTTSYSTGKLNSFSKQTLSGMPHNEKHKSNELVSSYNLQGASAQRGAEVNAGRGRDNYQQILDATEIILGDSDDETDNTSSGLKIVSVASLSTDWNISPGDHNVMSNTRVQGQACRDTIIIPD